MGFWKSLDKLQAKLDSKEWIREPGSFECEESKPITYDSIAIFSLLIFISSLFGLAVIAFLEEIRYTIYLYNMHKLNKP